MLLPVFLKSTENAENRNILTTLDRLLTVFTCHQRNPNSDQENLWETKSWSSLRKSGVKSSKGNILKTIEAYGMQNVFSNDL